LEIYVFHVGIYIERNVYAARFSFFALFLTRYPVNLQTVVIRKTLLDDLDHWFDENLDLSEEYDFF